MTCESCWAASRTSASGMDHEHDAALRAGHAQMPAGAVVRDEGVVDGAGAGDGEELGDAGARGGEVMLDPGVGGDERRGGCTMWSGSGTGLEVRSDDLEFSSECLHGVNSLRGA